MRAVHCFPSWSSLSHHTCRLCHVKVQDKPKWEEKLGRAYFLPSPLSNPVFFSCSLVASPRGRRRQLASYFSFKWHHFPVVENGGRIWERTEVSVTVTKGVAYKGGYASTFLLVWSTFFIIFSTSSSFWVEGMMLQLKLYVCTSLSSEPPIFKNLLYYRDGTRSNYLSL